MQKPGRQGIIIGATGLIVLIGTLLWLRRPTPAQSERQYATRFLAESLARSIHPRNVIVIGNPFAVLPNHSPQAHDFEKAGVEGLRKGFDREVALKVAYPHIKPSVLANPASVHVDPKSPTPLSFLIESIAFDELLKTNADCDLAISLIGLPVDLNSMEAWARPGPPRFGLLLPDWRIIGDATAIQKAFSSGKLAAAVVNRPGSADATDVKLRFLLIDSNNVAEALQQHPQLFGR
jgi:hypothetical protein